ncbi:MAG: phosphonate C-P lyase system protein PhnH [Gallionella sp.]|nr:phosphonate C-P lyase system protein PhnH [Gallionella sp.]
MQSDTAINAADIWLPQMQQQLFRGLLNAYSYPGRITICAEQNTPAWLAILTALVDGETTLADPQQLLSEAWWPKLEARRAPPERAAFILLDGSLAPELLPNLGTLEAPETGATLLLRVESLHSNETGDVRLHLSGPGIRQRVAISVNGLHPAWITSRNDWVANFPLGVEMVLCDAHRFVALPRTTKIVIGEAA